MPLASHDHVRVAVEPHLGRTTGRHGRQRRQSRPLCGLGFLAAKATAHAPDLHGYSIRRPAEHMGDRRLHLGWMLGRAVNQDIAVLLGNGERYLPLEIEVILPPNAHLTRQSIWRRMQHRLRIAPPHAIGIGHVSARGKCLLYG